MITIKQNSTKIFALRTDQTQIARMIKISWQVA